MAEQNIMDMSDEDFLNAAPSSFMTTSEDTEDNQDENQEDQSTSTQNDEHTEDNLEDDSEDESTDDDEQTDEDDLSSEDESDESEEGDTDEDEDESVDSEETDDVDYKSLHEKLLSPFKANGVEMSVQNVDEAIKLMQMGANYTKKMAALKPNLKLMKMLENNELLSEDKLNLLIDVAKGNPDAISQLVRDNKIDPLNLNTEEQEEYTPKNHTVGDNEVELDEVISRIQDSTSFADTMDIVSNKWDEASKRDIAQNPQQLEVINAHVSNGTYAKVIAEVNRIQMFGGLTGLSTFEAYKQVGQQMFEAGRITLDGSEPVKKETVVVKQKPKKRKDSSKATSPKDSSTRQKKTKDDFNPLAMSDEDFEKLLSN